MKVLMLSIDQKIFEEGSSVRSWMVEYGKLVDELHIIVHTKTGFEKTQISFNVFVYPTNTWFRPFYFFHAYNIARKIVKRDSGFVVTSQDFFTNFLAVFLKWRFEVPFQLQIHTDVLNPYFRKQSFVNFLRYVAFRMTVRFANCIRVVSQRIKNSLVSKLKVPESKITILSIYTDIGIYRNALIKTDLHQKYPQFDFIILMASRLTKEKNIEMAISAMEEIVKENSKVGLVILGEGPMKKNQESRIKNYGLKDNVILENWSNDLTSYYKTADMFLLASNYEGYGRTVIEAMASNCFVVMTDVGIAGDIIQNEYNGIVISVGDRRALIEEIKKAVKDGAHINNMIISAEKTLSDLPTKEEYLLDTKEGWEKCLIR